VENIVTAILSKQRYVMKIKDKYGKMRDHTEIICNNCGIKFLKATRFLAKCTHHFCSGVCNREFTRRSRILVQCAYCSKEIIRPPNKINKINFCSRNCKEKAQSYKSGLLKCGIGEPRYRTIAFATYKHICDLCGENFELILEVHHIDGNRFNNNKDNLMILCPCCHVFCTKGLIIIRSDRKIIIIEKYYDLLLKRFLGGLAHAEERLLCSQEVIGAEPISSTILRV
jgi:predicted nucleic acid-binding Zn ribbon protein